MTDAVAVVVTGALGSGKTTLARELAEHLRATLLSGRPLLQIFCDAPTEVLAGAVNVEAIAAWVRSPA